MRAIPVDERDSTWEDLGARYRLYRFEGSGNAVTTVDILDASVDEALEVGALSTRAGELWSLALVTNNAAGRRGLVWLSGYDYNDPPSSPEEWRARRVMQNRYLSAQSLERRQARERSPGSIQFQTPGNERARMLMQVKSREQQQQQQQQQPPQAVTPPVLPDGRRLIRFFNDHGHPWPLWESFSDKYTTEPADYGISDGLAERLRSWNEEYQLRPLDDAPDPGWIEEGWSLFDLLQNEVREIAEVRPEFDR